MRDEAALLRIDWIACKGYGVCAMAAPDLVTLDPWGYPLVDGQQPVTDELLRQARRAVGDCPTLAMSLDPASPRPRAWRLRSRRSSGAAEAR